MPLGQGLLLVGGQLRIEVMTDEDLPRLRDATARFLQVRHFAILLGAGSTMHLGSPRIRGLNLQGVLELFDETQVPLDEAERSLLERIVGERTIDLEGLLSYLTTAGFLMAQSEAPNLTVGDVELAPPELLSLPHKLNRALASACHLPSEERTAPEFQPDPFGPHREFIRKLLRARRGDLPRIRIFTTNYDLVIERTLDEAGIPYFDGFVGTVSRSLRPETFGQDIYSPSPFDPRRIMRAPDLLYLYKLHGSINWRSRTLRFPSPGEVNVVQEEARASDDDLSVIYPTPQKETDVLGYPYSEMFRWFAIALGQPETALLSIGYGFADEHVNRLLYQGLASNPTLQLFIVDPSVLDEGQTNKMREQPDREADIVLAQGTKAALAGIADARISILTGNLGNFVEFAKSVLPDPEALAGPEAISPELQAQLSEALLSQDRDELSEAHNDGPD
jgi:hypothetical protein